MLPRSARLSRSRDIQAVYRRRRSFSAPGVVGHVRGHAAREADELRGSRFGFVVSKKAAKKSHDRNRIKRRMREIFRCRILPRLSEDRSFDVLVVARAAAMSMDLAQLSADIDLLARQAGLLKD